MVVMHWWGACIQDGISFNMLCFTGTHDLLENVPFLRVCVIVNTCSSGGLVSLVNMLGDVILSR